MEREAGSRGPAPCPARARSSPTWGAGPGREGKWGAGPEAGQRGCCPQPGEGLTLTPLEVGGPGDGHWGSIRGAEGCPEFQCRRTPRSGRVHRVGACFRAVVTEDLSSSCRSLPWFGGFPGLGCGLPGCFLPQLWPHVLPPRPASLGETSVSPWPFKAICSPLPGTPTDVSLQDGASPHPAWDSSAFRLAPWHPQGKPSFSLFPAPREAPQGQRREPNLFQGPALSQVWENR